LRGADLPDSDSFFENKMESEHERLDDIASLANAFHKSSRRDPARNTNLDRDGSTHIGAAHIMLMAILMGGSAADLWAFKESRTYGLSREFMCGDNCSPDVAAGKQTTTKPPNDAMIKGET
jgi:hypothetical protein